MFRARHGRHPFAHHHQIPVAEVGSHVGVLLRRRDVGVPHLPHEALEGAAAPEIEPGEKVPEVVVADIHLEEVRDLRPSNATAAGLAPLLDDFCNNLPSADLD
jgi:hypothetical protein